MRWLLPLLLAPSLALAAGRSEVAVVISDDLEAYEAFVPPFLEALGETPVVHDLHGRQAEAEQVVAALRRDDPAVVFAVGAKAAYAVKNGLPSTPLVYAGILEPARYGIEGGQVTGVSMDVEPITLLSQFVGLFPSVKRIGVIRGPGVSKERMLAMAAAAVELDLTLVVREAGSPREVRGALHELAGQVDALWVPPDRAVLTADGFRTITEECRRRHLPLLADTANMVEAGGLFALVPDPAAVGRQAASIVKKLKDGAAPAVIPEQDPESLLLVLNVRTLERAEIPFDRLLLDFVDVLVQ